MGKKRSETIGTQKSTLVFHYRVGMVSKQKREDQQQERKQRKKQTSKRKEKN